MAPFSYLIYGVSFLNFTPFNSCKKTPNINTFISPVVRLAVYIKEMPVKLQN